MVHRAAVCLFWVGCITAPEGPISSADQRRPGACDRDRKGQPNFGGLLARDFKVLDNGVVQQVTVDDFSTGLAPISLVIAVQTSGDLGAGPDQNPPYRRDDPTSGTRSAR